jgi:uncharacterized protein YqfA (UPF0365 family)
VAQQRSSFGKLQRARDKQERAQAKAERRAARSESSGDEEPVEVKESNEAAIIAGLTALQEAFDDGQMSIEEFETRRDELRNQLIIG